MIEIPVYNAKGEEVGKEKLPEELFGLKPNPALVHQVLVAIQSSRRRPWAHTKDRSEVRGGGKKPWRQKGTGRARHGSSRSPIWSGGGVTFGPRKDRNFFKKTNKKMKKKAFWTVMSAKVAEKKIILMDEFKLAEPKTKLFAGVLAALPIKPTRTLVITSQAKSPLIRAGRNVPRVRVEHAMSLGLEDLLKGDFVVITKEGLEGLQKAHAYELAK